MQSFIQQSRTEPQILELLDPNTAMPNQVSLRDVLLFTMKVILTCPLMLYNIWQMKVGSVVEVGKSVKTFAMSGETLFAQVENFEIF